MKKHVVCFTTFNESQKQKLREVSDTLELHFDTEEDVMPYFSKASAIIGIIPESLREQIDSIESLELVQLPSAGYEGWDRWIHKAVLCNSSGTFGFTIAEYVIQAILSIYREADQYKSFQAQNQWSTTRIPIETLRYKNALILGVGDVGSTLASRLKAFGCRTIGLRKKKVEKEGFDRIDQLVNIRTYLPEADLVINCLPSNTDTDDFFQAEMFDLMPSHAIFVNVGRGKFVKTSLLEEVMRKQKIRAMVLDVFEEEPLPPHSSLWNEKSVYITPHISGGYASRYTKDLFAQLVETNLKNLVEHKPFKNQVNRPGFNEGEFGKLDTR